MSNKEIILRTTHLSKQFVEDDGRTFVACDDINLELKKGKTLAVVGESGSGKSTLLKMLMGMVKPTEGEIWYRQNEIEHFGRKELRELYQEVQMVFQDPLASFHPKMKVVDIVTDPLLNYKRIKRKDKEEKAKELLSMVELPQEVLNRYPADMSGGQRQRVAIARALSLEPEILLCDEITSALDVCIQKNIIELLVNMQKQRGLSMVFISHDLALVSKLAHQVMVMYLGHVVEVLPGEKVANESLHPYTKALLSAVYSVHQKEEHHTTQIVSEPSAREQMANACPFANRCPKAMPKCKTQKPKLQEKYPNHQVGCFLYQEN